MSILDLHEQTTLDAAPRYVAPKPAPKKFSAWGLVTAIPRGIGEAAAQVAATTAEVMAGYGDVMGRMESGQSLQDREPNMQSDFADALRDRGREFRPDPQTSHVAEELLYGFARGASKVVAGAVAAGPAGVLAAGGEEAVSAADDLRLQGVDLGTRTKAGLAQGAGLALAALPMAGQTLAGTAALYAAGGPAGFMAQQALTREILRGGGYDKLAEQYDPFDPVGLAVSALVPLPFAAVGMRSARLRADLAREIDAQAYSSAPPSDAAPVAAAVRQAYAPQVVDAARVAYAGEVRRSNALAPGLRGVETHEAALARAEAALSVGNSVEVSDLVPPLRIESLADFMRANRITDERPGPEVVGGFIGWVRQVGGIDFAQKWEITNERGGVTANPGGIFRRGGLGVDDLALQAEAAGYLRPGEGSDSQRFIDLVKEAVNGNRVLTMEEQGMKASRDAQAEQYAARMEAVEAKLKVLGVDTAPAKGNLLALEAYARANEPRLLGAALDEAAEARPGMDEYDALVERARIVAGDIFDTDRTLELYEAEVGPLSPVMRRMVAAELKPARPPAPSDATAPAETAPPQGRAPEAAAPAGSKASPGEAAETVAAQTRLASIRAQHPDLMVQLDGMDAPMRLDEFLAAVKREADEMEADAPLLQVAAECAILNGQ